MKAIIIYTEIEGSRVQHDSIKSALEAHGLFTTRISMKEGVKKLLRNGINVFDHDGNSLGQIDTNPQAKASKPKASKPTATPTIDVSSLRDIIQAEIRSAMGNVQTSADKPRRGSSVIDASNIQDAVQRYAKPSVEHDGYYVSDDVWKQILFAFKTNKPILLTGASGTGKTDLVRVIGSRLGLGVYSVDCSANRFYVINIDYAPQDVEVDILTRRDGITKADATRITGIAKTIRQQASSGDLTRSVSLRELFIASEQIAFGFSLEDALENAFIGGFQIDEQMAIRDLIRTQ